MKYQPGLPKHNDNVSHEHPLKDFAVILAWLVAFAALLFWLMGMAIDYTVDRISPATEARLYSLMPSKPLETAPGTAPQQAQLQALADSMRSCAKLAIPLKLAVATSEVPNAAVFPGGQIVVFSGLMQQVKSENGLAFVLAHELAHIAERDHLRAVGRGIVVFALSALVTGSDSGLSELLAPVGALGQARYSRTRESGADAAALRILQCRYGHAGGATEFFESMKDKDSQFALTHYAASHPAMQERIDALNGLIRDGQLPVRAVTPLLRTAPGK